MAYSILEQYSRDIDFYIFNPQIGFLHFASAGGILPKIIVENDLLNDSLHNIFFELPIEYDYEINPNLREILNLSDLDFENYTRDFIQMAQRGFYSFDRTYINNRSRQEYHIVAWPKFDLGMCIEHAILDRIKPLNIILNTSQFPFSKFKKNYKPFPLNIDME